MARQDFEDWLERADGDDLAQQAKQRMRSQYFDVLEWCRQEYGNRPNLYALAAYVAWWHMPRQVRQPQTQLALAHLLGFSNDDVFRKWRPRYPALFSDERTRSIVEQIVLERTADIVDAAIVTATQVGAQGFQDRKMLLEIAGVYRPASRTEISGPNQGPVRTAHELSDDELLHIIAGSR